MAEHRKILVIGAGFSGVALAIQLLKRTTAQVVLVERSGVFGRGVAYAAHGEANVLNVRASRMSALACALSHFTDWLAANAPKDADPNGFPRRPTYGAYLSDTLRTEAAGAPGRFVRRAGQAVALEAHAGGVTVRLDSGAELAADAAVLAMGNFAPSTPAGAEGAVGEARYIECSWTQGAFDDVGRDEDVILLGSGLTAVDALLELEAKGWRGRATVVSRRGLLPHAHDAAQIHAASEAPARARLSYLVNVVRSRCATTPWGQVMDELRPHGQLFWTRMSLEERRRFLRHLRPWWDIHRHRIAPDVAMKLARLQAEGRLDVVAGKLISAKDESGSMTLTLRPRGRKTTRMLSAPWLVNCTGPEMDVTRTADPLLAQLFGAGVARADDLKLGVDVDASLRVHDAFGRIQPRLFAIGPMTRGAFWETVAVPDIRVQALSLADTIAAMDADRDAIADAEFEHDDPSAEFRL
ncbi:MAG TPA: FAD/NAD(P)-binding protein [Caulobacteraceae bacterium]|jgi:uncharacterized NAD(P)/FAD-binding protein YdhS|nr:FAD/NAD(P)-binding protein [Caulobacteraceae bacterium]